MATFTLDDIRNAAEAKYGSTDIQVGDVLVRLLNPLRLSKTNRAALMATQKLLETKKEDSEDGAEVEEVEEVDQEETFHKIIVLVAETEFQAKALLDAIGDDLAQLASVFEMYSEGTQAGEASASQD